MMSVDSSDTHNLSVSGLHDHDDALAAGRTGPHLVDRRVTVDETDIVEATIAQAPAHFARRQMPTIKPVPGLPMAPVVRIAAMNGETSVGTAEPEIEGVG